MNKLWINFYKGAALFVIGIIAIRCVEYVVLTYLESKMFESEELHAYRMIVEGIALALVLLLPFLTMMKPIRAIKIEKDRRITQWGITGVRPEDQKKEDKE